MKFNAKKVANYYCELLLRNRSLPSTLYFADRYCIDCIAGSTDTKSLTLSIALVVLQGDLTIELSLLAFAI